MEDLFKEYKLAAMERLQKAKEDKEVDEDAVPFLDIINSHPRYFTSSSCYGRINVIYLPTKSKKDSDFVGKWHRKVSFEEVKKVIENSQPPLWFKMEPYIIHITCCSIDDAANLLELKQKLGQKRGGIFSLKNNRIQIELEGTNRMEVPVKTDNFQIDDNYLRILIDLANVRFEKNQNVWESLKSAFQKIGTESNDNQEK
ncbi:tRNA wybutosine-synthesizing protein [Anaeramoeba ignava]|uniref:tRNA(Phe) 7-[(3-amino-3-carboxypropyl)-4-demethylwyosine(37)-N(4)]-methyltransferase n=1 Tax=Anaeramoeba ignava TaxID=1746090 RepID=A0A9Q0RC69_ANAIG|nr:tRNA wybutosine-synthesizing protein [Anaeramoeba ignava]